MEFGDRLGVAGGCGLESFFQRHGVGAGRVFLAAEGAEPAGGDADVGRIDVAVDVEVGLVAVHALAHVIGEPSDGEDVAGAIEGKRVLLAEAFAGQHFVFDGDLVARRQSGTGAGTCWFDDIAAVGMGKVRTQARILDENFEPNGPFEEQISAASGESSG